MTREEICNSMTLQDAIQVFRDTNAYGTMDIAKTVILEALEQQTSEDYISRKAAIDALWKALHEYEDKTEKQFIESKELDVADWIQHRIFVQNMSDIDRQTILNLPSVTPQQKIGHWTHDGSNWTNRWICSECGYKLYYEQSRFCPDCGSYNGGAKNE